MEISYGLVNKVNRGYEHSREGNYLAMLWNIEIQNEENKELEKKELCIDK